MSLDITFTHRKNVVCPKCGETIGTSDVRGVFSGGQAWYPFLESIGYYVPYEQRTEENDWYGKDMVLTAEQANEAYRFVGKGHVYGFNEIAGLIAGAMVEGDAIVVNADW